MEYKLTILENAIDSLNESLSKFEQGQNGNVKAHKFSILHMAHFIELTLKYSVQKYTPYLVYSGVFNRLNDHKNNKQFKEEHNLVGLNISEAYEKLQEEEYDFTRHLKGDKPHTISVTHAVECNRYHVCPVTKKQYLDIALEADITQIKELRNDIEHFTFVFNAKEVRLCLGRLIRDISSFIECLDLFDLEELLDEKVKAVFDTLSDEYEQDLQEARITVQQASDENAQALRYLSPKDQMIDGHLYEFKAYDCYECGQDSMMIQNDSSSTGYKCAFCGNEESDEIEYPCDVCGTDTSQHDLSMCGEVSVCEYCHPSRWMGD